MSVSPSTLDVAPGVTFVMAARVEIDGQIAMHAVVWSASDASVATIDAAGRLTTKRAGALVVRASAAADPRVVGTASVLVCEPSCDLEQRTE